MDASLAVTYDVDNAGLLLDLIEAALEAGIE